MSKNGIGIALAIILFSSPTVHAEHTTDPIFASGNLTCTTWGYSNITGGTGQDFMASQIRIKAGCKYKNFSSLFETDLSGLDDRVAANYIVQGWVAYNFGNEGLWGDIFSNVSLKVGRFQTAAGRTKPAPYNRITINEDEANPFETFGTGVQMQAKLSDTVKIAADVTGATGTSGLDKKNWSRIETSQIITWEAVKGAGEKPLLELSFANQWSDFFHRFGLEIGYSPTERFDFYAGLYRSDENPLDKAARHVSGGFVLGDYLFYKDPKFHLRTHAMFDAFRGTENFDGYTVGIQGILPKGGGYGRMADSSVTIDWNQGVRWDKTSSPIEDKGVMLRIRIFF